jgi:hypothetical protein
MKNRLLVVAVCLLPLFVASSQSSAASKQLIVSLSRGGFVAFRSETEWANAKKGSQFSRVTSSVLSSQALVDENQIIHRLLFDANGKVLFGYDLLVEPDTNKKQFRIAVKPMDAEFEISLSVTHPELYAGTKGAISTLPSTAEVQVLDDGDAFSLDLLINETTGIKIVDKVKVSFDQSDLWEVNPRALPRDFTLEAVELAIADYRVLLNGEVVAVGKRTSQYQGPLIWFYLQGHGRFIFSLTPRPGYEFRKVATVDDNKIRFDVGGDQYELISGAPILGAGGTWNLWMLYDKHFTPLISPPEPPPTHGKDSLERLDAAVKITSEKVERMRQVRANTLNSKTLNRKTETDTVEKKKPQVLIGGAVRIEDLLAKP